MNICDRRHFLSGSLTVPLFKLLANRDGDSLGRHVKIANFPPGSLNDSMKQNHHLI